MHDEARQTVVVPFRQELWDDGARMELVRRTWRYTEYRVAFMHGTLTIGHVEAIRADDDWDWAEMLFDVDYDKAMREIVLSGTARLRMRVSEIDVEAVVGDEVAGHVRRRIGRFLGSGTDVPMW